MLLAGWGKYPVIDVDLKTPKSIEAIGEILSHQATTTIARGMGRSYGDSSLAQQVISSQYLDHFLSFDTENGLLRCRAGVSLNEILRLFVPKGWFLPVTPGTKYISIGGAIAADVHGKNHHCHGTFCDHIRSLQLILASGETIACSAEENKNLFHATCGGMGLTGIITEAVIKLKPITSSHIMETTYKASNLDEAFNLFEQHEQVTYSVAWIDCLARGEKLGRSLIMLGEHTSAGKLITGSNKAITIPIDLPGWLLNKYSIQTFNFLYYNRLRQNKREHTIHYEPFFYPLDTIHQWNNIYGKNGFTQYQFVLPTSAGREGMKTILKKIADSGRGSFLAVLKAFGPENNNYLSFPIKGYTLALDFKIDKGLFSFLDELDAIVLDHGGRLYLAKDVRMNEKTFKKSYPLWASFQEVRQHYGAIPIFSSKQAQRIGL
ncbi:MAG: FAD-binding oxidoreductase [Desulfobulbaceae bacterium]|nr:FAD-binding oxidoreductase [Desulfobulbaceae bacterium]